MTASEMATVRAGYDLVAASYTADRSAAGTGGDIDLLDAFLAQLSPQSRVLDAGCGAGIPVGDRVVAAGHSLVGLDFSISQLGLARTHVPTSRLVQGDLTTLPVRNATVDAVVSFYAIIHVPRDLHTRVFAEVFRVLRPGGRALLCLGWGDLPEDHDPESWLGVPMYWSHFDADTNLALLRDTGFTIESSTEVPDPMAHASHQFVMAVRP